MKTRDDDGTIFRSCFCSPPQPDASLGSGLAKLEFRPFPVRMKAPPRHHDVWDGHRMPYKDASSQLGPAEPAPASGRSRTGPVSAGGCGSADTRCCGRRSFPLPGCRGCPLAAPCRRGRIRHTCNLTQNERLLSNAGNTRDQGAVAHDRGMMLRLQMLCTAYHSGVWACHMSCVPGPNCNKKKIKKFRTNGSRK